MAKWRSTSPGWDILATVSCKALVRRWPCAAQHDFTSWLSLQLYFTLWIMLSHNDCCLAFCSHSTALAEQCTEDKFPYNFTSLWCTSQGYFLKSEVSSTPILESTRVALKRESVEEFYRGPTGKCCKKHLTEKPLWSLCNGKDVTPLSP